MKKQISIRLDTEIIKRLKTISKKNKKTFTQLLTDVLWDYIQQEVTR